jgi:hypothetical protein
MVIIFIKYTQQLIKRAKNILKRLVRTQMYLLKCIIMLTEMMKSGNCIQILGNVYNSEAMKEMYKILFLKLFKTYMS